MQRNEKYLYVIDEQRQFYQHINEANDHLETKASAILQSGSFITGLISAAKLVTGTTASALATVTLIAVLILFFAMLVLSLLVWLPKGYTAPGKANWYGVAADRQGAGLAGRGGTHPLREQPPPSGGSAAGVEEAKQPAITMNVIAAASFVRVAPGHRCAVQAAILSPP